MFSPRVAGSQGGVMGVEGEEGPRERGWGGKKKDGMKRGKKNAQLCGNERKKKAR